MKGSKRSHHRIDARERDFQTWWKRAEVSTKAPSPVLSAHGAFMAGYRACYRYDRTVTSEPVLRALVTALELLQGYAAQIREQEGGDDNPLVVEVPASLASQGTGTVACNASYPTVAP